MTTEFEEIRNFRNMAGYDFSQFPHNYDFGCPFYRDGLCYEDGHVGKQGGVGGVGRQASSVTSWNLSQSCI